MVSNFFRSIKNFVFPDEEKRVLILGYTTAGKTTIIEQLLQQKILADTRRETHGSRTREIEITLGERSHKFKATDVGGSDLYQDIFWKAEVAKADGIIYVIDASLLNACDGVDTDLSSWKEDGSHCPNYDDSVPLTHCGCPRNEKFNKSREAKSFAFSILDTGKPILIFLNKMDLRDIQPVYNQEKMHRLYKIGDQNRYNTKILSGSALVGDNVFEGVEWLFSQME